MRLILMRHGKAESNESPLEREVGSHANLLPEGIRQVNQQTLRIARFVTTRTIYASPKARCQQTALIIAENLNFDIVTDDRLTEIYKGDWEGRPVKEVIELEAAVDIDDRPTYRPPGGENHVDVSNRMADFTDDLLHNMPDETHLAVTHNHCAMMLTGRLLGMPLPQWTLLPVSYASLTGLVYENGGWNIDTEISPHLERFARR